MLNNSSCIKRHCCFLMCVRHRYDFPARFSCERNRSAEQKLIVVLFSLTDSHSTRLLAATTLRNVLGTKNLAEILSERETISHTMQSSLDEATDPWGVKVERVEM